MQSHGGNIRPIEQSQVIDPTSNGTKRIVCAGNLRRDIVVVVLAVIHERTRAITNFQKATRKCLVHVEPSTAGQSIAHLPAIADRYAEGLRVRCVKSREIPITEAMVSFAKSTTVALAIALRRHQRDLSAVHGEHRGQVAVEPPTALGSAQGEIPQRHRTGRCGTRDLGWPVHKLVYRRQQHQIVGAGSRRGLSTLSRTVNHHDSVRCGPQVITQAGARCCRDLQGTLRIWLQHVFHIGDGP
mmetsp:Transcript_7373/g.17472  ORF Transcript_7373/g.17472 Transcript_7373/m.17472 type:complete len:242 (-) Transcript_7373:2050-2775(-)